MQGLDPILLARAGGTIPLCDPVLISFTATLAQRYGWTCADMVQFLMAPWKYQKDWNEWLKEMQETT